MVKRGFTAPHRNQVTVVEVEGPPHFRAKKEGGEFVQTWRIRSLIQVMTLNGTYILDNYNHIYNKMILLA
jgi:hypothetical protein